MSSVKELQISCGAFSFLFFKKSSFFNNNYSNNSNFNNNSDKIKILRIQMTARHCQ
jgi:hypothetical protein